MALTSVEEAQLRDLIAQQSALLSLASSEATIISKLGATKKNIGNLSAASTFDDTDLLVVRQGTTDKSIAGSVVKSALAPTDASTTVKGVVELATNAEAQALANALKAITPATLAAAIIGSNLQTWQDVTGSRALATVYTNSTGRPIQIFVTGNFDSGSVVLNGTTIAFTDGTAFAFINLIIPAGQTYRINGTSAVITSWSELR